MLSEFRIDQWWFAELEAAVKDGTTDQKRAVFVVRNLLETLQRALHPLLGAKQDEAVPQDVLKDAQRYRWLRSKSHKCMNRAWIGSAVVKAEGDCDFFSLDEAVEAIDAAIDAAIAAAQQPKEQSK